MTARNRVRLICGCGFLGSRVAARWLAAGDRVLGITRGRSEALAAAGIEPVVADLGAHRPLPSLPPLDTVFWAVGFGGGRSGTRATGGPTAPDPRGVHVRGLARLLDHVGSEPDPNARVADAAAAGGGPRVVLSSSTGVWGSLDGGLVDETTPAHPDRDNGRILLEAEAVLRDHRRGPGVALRFAGLYGPGRLPRLDDLRAGRPIPVDPDSWLNLIHVDDAARVVTAVADHPSPAALYVVSDGKPILRRDWYVALAARTGSPPPTWSPPAGVQAGEGHPAGTTRGSDKRVDARRLWDTLGLRPLHPSAVEGTAPLIHS
jgi:nucleoside-diphosphate-sugar epimerase